MAAPALPPGFVLEKQAPALPPGFELEKPASATPTPKPEPSLMDRARALPGQIVEAVTGSQRSTPETQALPDWADMPELNSFSLASAKTGLGTLLANPQETVQVIQSNFPGVQVRQDERGNFLLRSSIDGNEYAIKPGFRASDVPRAVGAAVAFTPAGRATSLGGMALGAGATQAVIEGTQAATGGQFNPGDVAAATVLAPALPALGVAAGAVKRGAGQLAAKARGVPAPVAPVAPAMPQGTQGTQGMLGTPPAAAPAMGADELGATMRQASVGGFGSKRAERILAQQVAPDAETVAAAERLGITEHLQPDHITTNQAYRQLAQLVKSQTGSEAAVAQRAGLEKVAERASGLIDELGGSADSSTLSSTLRGRMEASQAELEKTANRLYDEVRAMVPAKTPAPADSVLEFIGQRADDLGGQQNLSAAEKVILRRLGAGGETPPTYALLDDVRKDLGSAARMSGPFKDADTGLAKKLYSLLSDDQAAAIAQSGASEVYDAARQSIIVRKALEDDMTALFGKQLDRSLAPLLSGSVKKLGQGDTSAFIKMISAVPKDMRQQVTASGLASFFQRTARGGEMDFAGYSKWFDALQTNKQANAALMANLPPGAAQHLADLAKVSRGIAMAKGEFIATGKAINPRVLEAADSMMRRVYEEVARRGAAGAVAETITSAAGMPGLASAMMSATMKNRPPVVQAADKLITSPEFVQAVRAQGTPAAAVAARSFAFSKPFSRFARALGNPREMADRERWVANALQAQNNLTEDTP